MGPWGPLGLFRSHSEWKVISSGRLFRKERGGWAHGALWGNSEAIPNGMDGHFEWKVIPVCTLRFGTYRTPGRPCKISGTSRGTSLKWPKTWASSNKPRGLNSKPFGPPGLDLERFGPPELDLKPFGYPRLDLGAFGPPGLDLWPLGSPGLHLILLRSAHARRPVCTLRIQTFLARSLLAFGFPANPTGPGVGPGPQEKGPWAQEVQGANGTKGPIGPFGPLGPLPPPPRFYATTVSPNGWLFCGVISNISFEVRMGGLEDLEAEFLKC